MALSKVLAENKRTHQLNKDFRRQEMAVMMMILMSTFIRMIPLTWMLSALKGGWGGGSE